MKKVIILLAFCLVASITNSQDSRSINYPELNEFILEQMEINHVPGLSACMIIGDSVVWNHNYGYMNLEEITPVTDSTLFNVYSIGKTLTTACVMQLWDDQLLGLDENINGFLPFQMTNPWNGATNFTARMLMTHSSTINNGDPNVFVVVGDPTIPLGEFLEDFLSIGGAYYSPANYYNAMPGTQFNYDNYGMALNGFLVEPLTEMFFHEYADDYLFTPLEMDASAWFLAELNMDNLAVGYDYSGGNFIPNLHIGHPAYPGMALRSTALELANFEIMMLNHGVFKGQVILSEDAVDSMMTVQNPAWAGGAGPTGLGMFMCEDFGDRVTWGHYGGSSGGYAAQMFYCPEEQTGVVITTNSEQWMDATMTELFDYAARIVIPEEVTDITETGFTLNWRSAPAAVSYRIDVSTNFLFTEFVEGYEDLNVGPVTSFEVGGLECEMKYYCRIRSFDGAGPGPNSSFIIVTTGICVGLEEHSKEIISFNSLPNPVHGICHLSFVISQCQSVSVKVFNVNGKEVAGMLNNYLEAGFHRVECDLSTLPAGIYFLRLQAGKELMTIKVVKL